MQDTWEGEHTVATIAGYCAICNRFWLPKVSFQLLKQIKLCQAKQVKAAKKKGCWREITGRGEGAFFSRKQSILRVKTCVRAVIGRGQCVNGSVYSAVGSVYPQEKPTECVRNWLSQDWQWSHVKICDCVKTERVQDSQKDCTTARSRHAKAIVVTRWPELTGVVGTRVLMKKARNGHLSELFGNLAIWDYVRFSRLQ